jgi:hypothetical protein
MTLNNELSDIVKDVSTNLAKIGHHAWLPKRFAYDDLLHCERFGPHTQTTDGMKFYQNNFALLQGIVCASSIIFFPDTLPSISQYVVRRLPNLVYVMLWHSIQILSRFLTTLVSLIL